MAETRNVRIWQREAMTRKGFDIRRDGNGIASNGLEEPGDDSLDLLRKRFAWIGICYHGQ